MKILKDIKMWALALGLAICGATAMAPATYAKVVCLNGSSVDNLKDCDENKGSANVDTKLEDVLKNIVNVIIGIIGFVAVVMMVYGGFLYTTSAGDANKVTKAKNTIMYGLIGLVVALLAFAIVNFVVSNFVKSE